MKFNMTLLLAAIAVAPALAQTKSGTTKKKDEGTEIIHGTKGEKGTKERTVIVIENGVVSINGEPAGQVNRRIVIGDTIVINGKGMARTRAVAPGMMGPAKHQAFLGVSTEKKDEGAAVKEVVKGSAAAKAGLKEGDIITEINGEKITDEASLSAAVRRYQPDETIDVSYLRQNKSEKVKVILGKTDNAMAFTVDRNFMGEELENMFRWQPNGPMPFAAPRGPGSFNFRSPNGKPFMYWQQRPRYGMGVEDNAEGDGAKVSTISPNSQAEKAGMMVADIITAVDDKPVKTVDDLRELLAQSSGKTALNITVLRNGKTTTLRMAVPKIIKTANL